MALFSLRIGLGGVNLFFFFFSFFWLHWGILVACAFSSVFWRVVGATPVLVHRLLTAVASVIAEHRL